MSKTKDRTCERARPYTGCGSQVGWGSRRSKGKATIKPLSHQPTRRRPRPGGFRDLDEVYVCTASTFQVVFSLKRGVFRHRFGSPTPQSDTDPRRVILFLSDQVGHLSEISKSRAVGFSRRVAPRPLYNEKKAFSLWPRSDMSTEQDAASRRLRPCSSDEEGSR